MNYKIEKQGEKVYFVGDGQTAELEKDANFVTLNGERITMQTLAEELMTARKDLEASNDERNSLIERIQQQGTNVPQGRNTGATQTENNQRGNEQPDSNNRASTTGTKTTKPSAPSNTE